MGNKLNISELIIVDFVIETLGLILAMIYIQFFTRLIREDDGKILFLITIVFGICLLLSNYGLISWNLITSLPFADQIPYFTGVVTTVLMYVRSIKSRPDMSLNTIKEEQGIMSNFATIAMIALWLSMVLIIFI
jgi:hypothetical protein